MTFTKNDVDMMTNFFYPMEKDVENAFGYRMCYGKKYQGNLFAIIDSKNAIFSKFSTFTKNKITKEVRILSRYEGYQRDAKDINAYVKHLKKLYKIVKKAFDKVVL